MYDLHWVFGQTTDPFGFTAKWGRDTLEKRKLMGEKYEIWRKGQRHWPAGSQMKTRTWRRRRAVEIGATFATVSEKGSPLHSIPNLFDGHRSFLYDCVDTLLLV